MKAISQLRFDSLAGYSRSPTMALVARDLAWFEESNERILGLIALDLPDQDYVSYVLGRDAKGRFRAVWLECSIASKKAATEVLQRKLAEFAQARPRNSIRATRSAHRWIFSRRSSLPIARTECSKL